MNNDNDFTDYKNETIYNEFWNNHTRMIEACGNSKIKQLRYKHKNIEYRTTHDLAYQVEMLNIEIRGFADEIKQHILTEPDKKRKRTISSEDRVEKKLREEDELHRLLESDNFIQHVAFVPSRSRGYEIPRNPIFDIRDYHVGQTVIYNIYDDDFVSLRPSTLQ